MSPQFFVVFMKAVRRLSQIAAITLALTQTMEMTARSQQSDPAKPMAMSGGMAHMAGHMYMTTLRPI